MYVPQNDTSIHYDSIIHNDDPKKIPAVRFFQSRV